MTNPHIVVVGTRRSWSPEQKRAILAEADDPATTASAVARRHGLHSSLLFRWRRAVLAEHQPGRPPSADLRPARPAASRRGGRRETGRSGRRRDRAGRGHRLRAEAGADLALLQGVIAALLHR